MAKKRKSVTTKNTQKQKKSIEINVAKTLQEALQHAEKNGLEHFGYEGVFYVKVNGNWTENDIIPELLQFPQYKKVYDEYRVKKDCGELMAKDLLLVMFSSNIGNGGEYDISNQI